MSFRELVETLINNWGQILIAISAFAGVILSVYNMINQKKMASKKLNVTFSFGFIVAAGTPSKETLLINISNPTKFTIVVKSVGFLLPDKKMAVILNPESNLCIPCDLEPEKDLTIRHDLNCFKLDLSKGRYSGVIKTRAYCLDAIGRRHISKPLKIKA